MQWYYAEQGQQKGPIEEAALIDLVNAGVVRDDTLVWHEGLANWQTYSAVRGMRMAAASTPSSQQAAPQNAAQGQVPAYVPHNYAARVLSVRYAGFWIRFLARLIDGIILNVALLAVRIPLGLPMFATLGSRNPAALMAAAVGTIIVSLVSLLVGAGYEIYFVSAKGATLGKMALGLQVVRIDGAPISMSQSAGRYFAQWLSAITLMIGYIMAAFDDQKRALHDRICDTRVIRVR